MRYFFIDHSEISKPVPLLKGSDEKHIIDVLRLKPGDTIGLCDGNGRNYKAVIKAFSFDGIELSIVQTRLSNTESNIKITVAQAFLKDKKMDAIVRQITELGVHRWIPFIAHRSVARPDRQKLKKRRERWKKITKEATKQCGRGYMVEISEMTHYEDILKDGKKYDKKIIFWENALEPLVPPSFESPCRIKQVLIVLGPEGGFTPDEIDSAKSSGFKIAGLGPRILRSDTATITSVVLVQFLLGDMGGQ